MTMVQRQANCTDLNESGLISVDEAVQHIVVSSPILSFDETVALENACGRTLQQEIIASFNVPAHTNSAVDGYAILSEDIPKSGSSKRLKVDGLALAGASTQKSAQVGTGLRIMTGAIVPVGFDVVIMQEQVQRQGDFIRFDANHKAGQNIRLAGEDIKQGQVILAPGKYLTPPDIGLIASLGIIEVRVKRKLRIAIASTGDEVHNLDAQLDLGGVYDSNRYTLMAALSRPDIEIINLGIIADQADDLLAKFNETARHCDVIISSGGVSVGAADYTRLALEASGHVNFWKVAIKPGRPLAFGKIADTVFFGLPGNPVAVMVAFYQFVLPALEKMLGILDQPIRPTQKAVAKVAIRKRQGRTEIQRGIIDQDEQGIWHVKTTGQQGSGILRSMSLANAFIILDHDSGPVAPGDRVTVQAFSTFF